MTRSEEYAIKILKDVKEQDLDASIILQTIKGLTLNDLNTRESTLMKELSVVRTEILMVRKA